MNMLKGLGNFFRGVVPTPKTNALDLTEVSQGIAEQVVRQKSRLELETEKFKSTPEYKSGVRSLPSPDPLGDPWRNFAGEHEAHIRRCRSDGSFAHEYLQVPVPPDPPKTSAEQVKASIDQWHERAARKSRIVSETYSGFPRPDESQADYEKRQAEHRKKVAARLREKERAAEAKAEIERQAREIEAIEQMAAYESNPKFGQF